MKRVLEHVADPNLDLVLERVIDVPVELVWKAWTTPEHLMKWFTPKPWKTVECEIDLRPGGKFRTVMESPEGKRFPGVGCYLEIVENEKLAWTSVLAPGYRPTKPKGEKECDELEFSAVITMKREGTGTRYRALAIHGEPESKKKHEEMGFHDGWSAALNQLVEEMKKL